MKKFSKVLNDKMLTWILMGLGTIMILFYYLRNVPHINTVWELVDEYGYLANAAYLSGTDWAWVSNAYYGFGYSLWLIPFFIVCNSGTRMIQGAIIVNVMCVIALFMVQIVLMKKICKNLAENLVIIISFVLCFYPYVFASGMKVLPECLLTLMIWVCGLLLYQAFVTGKWYYYALTAVATVYTFFVHTRAFVFCAAIILVLLIMLLQKSVSVKNFVIFCVVGGVLLVLGYVLKNEIIDAVYSVPLFQGSASEVAVDKIQNTLTIEYILRRIGRIFTDFSIQYLLSFACKNFYLLVATAGMFHIGIGYIAKDVILDWKQRKKLTNENALKLMYGVAAVVMILAQTIQSPGNVNKPAYYFYGRYYEYLIGPIVFVGLKKCIQKRLPVVGKLSILAGMLLSVWGTLCVEKYLEDKFLYFDSNRIASFAYCAHKKIMYDDVVLYWLGVAGIAIVVIFVLNYFVKLRKLLLIVPVMLFYLNNVVIEGNILYMHQENTNFYEVATFIHSNYDTDEVYFLNGDFIERTAYAGIQSLLGQEKLTLIEIKDSGCLESGDLVVTYLHNSPIDQLEIPVSKVGATKGYAIYLVQ